MSMDSREKILQAALRVFGEAGYLGATTRRIAQEAGVNEVTIFRHFGSKDELIREAIRCGHERIDALSLPAEPVDPERELAEWSRDQMAEMYGMRSVIRACMGESETHEEFAERAGERPRHVTRELTEYLLRLQRAGMAEPDFDPNFAASMLMGALFSDILGRDFMPDLYGYSLEDGAAEYAALFVRAIGAGPRPGARADSAEDAAAGEDPAGE